jgi:hypothetical protein
MTSSLVVRHVNNRQSRSKPGRVPNIFNLGIGSFEEWFIRLPACGTDHCPLALDSVRALRRLKMLADKDAMATIAVKDLAAAKKFYQQKLGFTSTEEAGVVTLRSDNSTIVVYESQLAGTNKATSATWGVGNEMDSIVRSLAHFRSSETRTAGPTFAAS